MAVSWSVIVLGLLVVVVLGGVAGVRRWRRGRGPAEPSCGRCGYAVRGLTTFTCPECGGDLREVGIKTAALSGVSSFALLAAAWVIVFLTVGAIGLPLLGSIVPFATRARQHRVVFIQSPYLHATVFAESEWLALSAFAATATPPPRTPVRLTVDRRPPLSSSGSNPAAASAGAAQLAAPATLVLTQPATASEPTILKWMQQAGYAMTDPRAADRVHDLARCIDAMKQPTASTFVHLTDMTAHPASQFNRPGGALWFRIIYGLLWLTLLVAGLAWLRRRTGASGPAAVVVPVIIGVALAAGIVVLGAA